MDKLFKSNKDNTIDEAKLFEIAVKSVGLKNLHRNEERIKTEIKLAYEILKQVADEL